LWVAIRVGILNGFWAFGIVALAWLVAGAFIVRELPNGDTSNFVEHEPNHWREHWKYSRWVLVTALVFQLTTQGYYWLAAGFLSVKDVGELRAMFNLVTPIDQIFVALSLLILPMMSYRYCSHHLRGLLRMTLFYCAGFLLVTLAFAVAINLFGKPVMHLIYGGKFDDIAGLLGTLAFLPILMGIGNTLNDSLKAAEEPRLVFYAYLCSGAVTFIFGVPLVVHLGLRGAVYGLLLSATAYTSALVVGLISTVHRASTVADRIA
jgi:O-antigen/teichoic acid export membrane protein